MDESNDITSDDSITLPLFPLNVVLFPGMVLPLHIFEERYKTMIGDCVDRQEPFGVVLIKEGQEVGGPAEPFQIGTSARILRVEHLEEGRMNIVTRGQRRFATVEIDRRLPHLVGQVRYLEEEPGDVPPDIATEIGGEYAGLLRSLTTLTGGWTDRVVVPQDPVLLSYAVAANLELPNDVRQELLEVSTAGERLERLLPLLRDVNRTLQEEVARRNPFRGPRLN
jgi:Lon protease-like protein|tara:strand:+ start:150 stop:821 length:672 start_codon:yes stop_codon:yes gene_type:complete